MCLIKKIRRNKKIPTQKNLHLCRLRKKIVLRKNADFEKIWTQKKIRLRKNSDFQLRKNVHLWRLGKNQVLEKMQT